LTRVIFLSCFFYLIFFLFYTSTLSWWEIKLRSFFSISFLYDYVDYLTWATYLAGWFKLTRFIFLGLLENCFFNFILQQPNLFFLIRSFFQIHPSLLDFFEIVLHNDFDFFSIGLYIGLMNLVFFLCFNLKIISV